MKFASERTNEGRDFVLINEIIDRVHEETFQYGLQSGNLTVYDEYLQVVHWKPSMGIDGFYIMVTDANEWIMDLAIHKMLDEPGPFNFQRVRAYSSQPAAFNQLLEKCLQKEKAEAKLKAVKAGQGAEDGQVEKMPVEEFIKSLIPHEPCIWKAISKAGSKDEAKQAADDYFKKHPELKVGKDDLKHEFFINRKDEKSKRNIMGRIYQVILDKNVYEFMGKAKIRKHMITP